MHFQLVTQGGDITIQKHCNETVKTTSGDVNYKKIAVLSQEISNPEEYIRFILYFSHGC